LTVSCVDIILIDNEIKIIDDRMYEMVIDRYDLFRMFDAYVILVEPFYII